MLRTTPRTCKNSGKMGPKRPKSRRLHAPEKRVALPKKIGSSKPPQSPILAQKPHPVGSTRAAPGRWGVRKSLCVRDRRLSTKKKMVPSRPARTLLGRLSVSPESHTQSRETSNSLVLTAWAWRLMGLVVVGALGCPHTHPRAQHHHGWPGTKDVPALKEPVLVECN